MKEAGVTCGSLEAAAQDRAKWKQFAGYAPHVKRQRLKHLPEKAV